MSKFRSHSGLIAFSLLILLGACGSEATGETGAEVPSAESTASIPESGDALVPGTDYHATAQLACAINGGEIDQYCSAGVKRGWGEDGTTLVEITKPDGRKRAIFFLGTEAYGADSAQADGSAAYDFKATRQGDETLIEYGPERYIIMDAFVVGG